MSASSATLTPTLRSVSVSDIVTPGPLAVAVPTRDAGRYAVGAGGKRSIAQNPMLVPNLGALFHRADAGGYNAFELRRYWLFVRAVERRAMPYDRTPFRTMPPVLANLLGGA